MTINDNTTPKPKAQPVRNVQQVSAVIAAVSGALVLPSALNVSDTVSQVFAWIVFALSVAKVGLDAYNAQNLPNKVVPIEDAAAYVDKAGTLVAGPASDVENGVRVAAIEAHVDAVPVEDGSGVTEVN